LKSGGTSPLLSKVSTPPRPKAMGFASSGVALGVDRGGHRLRIEPRNLPVNLLALLHEREGNMTDKCNAINASASYWLTRRSRSACAYGDVFYVAFGRPSGLVGHVLSSTLRRRHKTTSLTISQCKSDSLIVVKKYVKKHVKKPSPVPIVVSAGSACKPASG
jgi:hypothetical protein